MLVQSSAHPGTAKSRFTSRGGDIHVDITTDIMSKAAFNAPLVAGFRRGDPVVYVLEDRRVDVGEEGTVVGPNGASQTRIMCGMFTSHAPHFT